MLSTVLFLSLFLLQLEQSTSFHSSLRVSNRLTQPLYANPLFFGGKRLPDKVESNKPKEKVVKEEYSIDGDEVDEDDVNQLVKIHDEERLQKVIARAGLASRREAEKMVSTLSSDLLYFVKRHSLITLLSCKYFL